MRNNNSSNDGVALGLAALLVALEVSAACRLGRMEMDTNARVYSRLMGGNPKDNWIKGVGFMTESHMKDCRFAIFSKYIPEMNEDFSVMKSRTYIERIISTLSPREIEEFFRNASRITDLQKSGFSDYFTSTEGRNLRSLYLKARRNAGLC